MHISTELTLEIEKMQSVLTELKESMLNISDQIFITVKKMMTNYFMLTCPETAFSQTNVS